MRRAVRVCVLVGGLALAEPGVAVADMVVLRADGGALAVGQTVATGAMVTLPAGASATLIGEDGGTVSLTGPYSGKPDAAGTGDAKVVTALARLLTQGEGDSSNLGATRAAKSQNPYGIIPAAGVHCQSADRAPVFTRAMAIGTGQLAITGPDAKEAKTAWAAGATDAPWPEDLAFAEGTYKIRVGLRPDPVTLEVHKVPAEAHGPAEIAVWMADHGCRRQALAVLYGLR